jgi:hypothetical protein
MQGLVDRKLTNPLRQVYRLAALSLAMGMSVEEAAAHSNLEPDRLAGYMRDPRFQNYLEQFNKEIEGKVIERVTRRQVKAIAKLQCATVEAAEKVIFLMQNATNESVQLQASKGILRQAGIDLDSLHLGDQLPDPEKEVARTDPSFFKRHEETIAELEADNAPSD